MHRHGKCWHTQVLAACLPGAWGTDSHTRQVEAFVTSEVAPVACRGSTERGRQDSVGRTRQSLLGRKNCGDRKGWLRF